MHPCICEYPESGVKSYSHIDLIYGLIKKANIDILRFAVKLRPDHRSGKFDDQFSILK